MLLLALTAFAEDTRGERLAALRAEVETARTALQREQSELDARLTTLNAARTEVEVEVARERLALERLQVQLESQRTEVDANQGQFTGLEPIVRTAIADLRAVISSGVPFRKTERLAALQELEDKLDAKTHTPDKAAARLWQFVEDELALRKENAIDRQVVNIGGQERLAEVARLGLVAMYYRTEDGEMGWANPDGSWTQAEGRTARAQIDGLFTALERRVRTGWFELPGGLPEGAL